MLQFTQAVVSARGQVSDEALRAFLDAGYGPDAVVEVVANVAVNVLTNYLNNVARTPVDFPRVAARGLAIAA